jgi:tetratricopeptide (TPR) repeat protein
MSSHLFRTGVFACATAIALMHVAHADPKAEAEAHIAKAQQLFESDKPAEALAELKTAYALDPRPELLYAIGQAHSSLGQCDDAKTFYMRFLDTKPSADVAAVTRQAMDACEEKTIEPPPPPPPDKDKIQPPPPPPPVVTRSEPRPWYTDYVADALVGGGVVCSVIGLMQYSSAKSDRDAADKATNFETFSDLIDSSNRARTLSIVFGASGAALIGAGIVRYVIHDRGERTVQVTPAPGGAAVSFGGRF